MRRAALVFALLALSGPILAASAAGAAPPASTAPRIDGPVAGGSTPHQFDAPTRTAINVSLSEGGSARWTIELRYPLSSDNETAAFRSFATEFENRETTVGLDVAFFERLAAASSNATGREMGITDSRYEATVANGTGVLSVSFTWSNFLTPTDDGYELRGAVMMPNDRTWLTSLGDRQRLRVETPPGYVVVNTEYGLDDGDVVIVGPGRLDEPLTVTYRETAAPQSQWPVPVPWLLGAGVLVVAVVLAALYLRRRPTGGGTATGEGGEYPSAGDGGARPSDGGAAVTEPSTDGDATASADAGPSEAEPEPAEPDVSLLSDEERVEHLLERNGGRMKQAQIVRETGWSDAKVSQLLSSMAEEDRVEKLRLGRENLISLPDEE
ncbi:helix-turn-helix transcriptional regulator [Salinirarus marinus]|uniref:helix-turn-helix transcriptional regulator n=1 Tax=Salinirarus marinus TaxID=3068310 RepID=UPI003C6C7935